MPTTMSVNHFSIHSSSLGLCDFKVFTIRLILFLLWTLWYSPGILCIPQSINILSLRDLCLYSVSPVRRDIMPSLYHLWYVTQLIFHDITCPYPEEKMKTIPTFNLMSKKTASSGIAIQRVSEDNFFLNPRLETWLPQCSTHLIGGSQN